MTSKNRKTITINLVVGKDDDLLTWVSNLPRGGRDIALRTVLRCGLELPQPAPETDSIQKLEIEVQNMQEAMSRLPTMLKQQPGVVDTSRLDELEQMILNFQDWMNAINHRVESLMQGIPVEISQPIIEAAPELSLEDRQQRVTKLKQARW